MANAIINFLSMKILLLFFEKTKIYHNEKKKYKNRTISKSLLG